VHIGQRDGVQLWPVLVCLSPRFVPWCDLLPVLVCPKLRYAAKDRHYHQESHIQLKQQAPQV
jgi:hypothetical protein